MEHALVIGTRRRCDNCSKFYTVVREHHRFCTARCRQEFHRFGSPLLRLRDRIGREVALASEAIELRMFSALDTQSQRRYATLYPSRARRIERQLAEPAAERAS